MVLKVKEISIGRGRKYSQNYQSIDYHIGITIEGTTAKDTVEDMIKKAVSELATLEIGEQSRCRDVIDIIGLEENREFKEAVNNVAKTLPEPQFNKETLEEKPKRVRKLPKGTKKINTAKIYNYRFADGKARTCNKCGDLLSFDEYSKETHPYGTHVDKDGHIIGDGECTLWEGEV